jgi:NADPH:quinone reductase-like Zn-dependent oxidoreductase
VIDVPFPLVLGRDLVGTVAAVGAGVAGVEPDRWVWTNSAGYGGRPGATAELVVVERDRLYQLPAGADPVDFAQAGQAHALVDSGQLPRTTDGMVGRIVLQP